MLAMVKLLSQHDAQWWFAWTCLQSECYELWRFDIRLQSMQNPAQLLCMASLEAPGYVKRCLESQDGNSTQTFSCQERDLIVKP